MFEAIERHARLLAIARTFQRPHSVIRFANNGSFELAYTYFLEKLSGGEAAAIILPNTGEVPN